MELLLVGSTKLKVTLTEEERHKYCLDGEGVDDGKSEVRRALWELLDEAKRRVGFDTANDKVLIQLYPLREGGCELFITKLGLTSPAATRTVARSDRVAMLASGRRIYRFPSLEELIAAARSLSAPCAVRESDAYLFEDGVAYLFLEERHGRSAGLSEFSRLLEYGDSVPADLGDYIREHGECLFTRTAVSDLSRLGG